MAEVGTSARSQTCVKPVIVPPQTLFWLVSCYTPMRSVPHAHQGLLPTTGRPIVAQLRLSVGWQAGSNRGGGRCSCSAQAGASLSLSYAAGLLVKLTAAQCSVRCRKQLIAACSSVTGQVFSSCLSLCRSFFFCCPDTAADWGALPAQLGINVTEHCACVCRCHCHCSALPAQLPSFALLSPSTAAVCVLPSGVAAQGSPVPCQWEPGLCFLVREHCS